MNARMYVTNVKSLAPNVCSVHYHGTDNLGDISDRAAPDPHRGYSRLTPLRIAIRINPNHLTAYLNRGVCSEI